MNLSAVLKCLPLFVHGFIFPPVVGGLGPRARPKSMSSVGQAAFDLQRLRPLHCFHVEHTSVLTALCLLSIQTTVRGPLWRIDGMEVVSHRLASGLYKSKCLLVN